MTKTIIFGTTIAITLFAAGFFALIIPNVEANDGVVHQVCPAVDLGRGGGAIYQVFDPNIGICVPPGDCEFGVDNTANPPHCNSPPTGDDDDDDDDDDDNDDDDD